MNLKTKRKNLKDYIKFIQDHLEDEGLKFEQFIESLDDKPQEELSSSNEFIEVYEPLMARMQTHERFRDAMLLLNNDTDRQIPDEKINQLFDNLKTIAENLRELKSDKNIKNNYKELFSEHKMKSTEICSQILKELK